MSCELCVSNEEGWRSRIILNYIKSPVLVYIISSLHAKQSKNRKVIWYILPREHFIDGSSYFNVPDQLWKHVYRMLKMKQNVTSNFQHCSTLIQRWNNIESTLHNIDATVFQRCLNIVSTLIDWFISTLFQRGLKFSSRNSTYYHQRPIQNPKSKMNLFVKRVNGFQQKAPSQMFEQVLNTPLTMVIHAEA